MTNPGQGVTDWYSGLDPDTQSDLKGYHNDVMYDSFANDQIYQAVFSQGNWGDIKDATFETFAEVKTYINDTVFATEHQTTYEEGEYVPSADRSLGDDPIYVDLSEYYADIDKSLPALYRKPDSVTLPGQLIRHSSNKWKLDPAHGEGDERERWESFFNKGDRFKEAAFDPETGESNPFYVGNLKTVGEYQSHLDEVKNSRIVAGREDFAKTVEENKVKADQMWARRTLLEGTYYGDPPYNITEHQVGHYAIENKPLFKHVIGSDKKEDIQGWLAMADIYSTRDSPDRWHVDFKKLKFVYDWFEGKLPTREEYENKYGDPISAWDAAKNTYNPFEGDELQGDLEEGPRWTKP